MREVREPHERRRRAHTRHGLRLLLVTAMHGKIVEVWQNPFEQDAFDEFFG